MNVRARHTADVESDHNLVAAKVKLASVKEPNILYEYDFFSKITHHTESKR